MGDVQTWQPEVLHGEVDSSSSVLAATRRSLSAARREHLAVDEGAREALLVLAEQVDYLRDNEWLTPTGKLDNTTLPTYLRYAESLGLTPAGRAKTQEAGGAKDAGKLGLLREQRPAG